METGSQGRGPWLENRRQWLGEGKEDRRHRGVPKARLLSFCSTASYTANPPPVELHHPGLSPQVLQEVQKGMVYHHLPIPGTASCWVCLGAVSVVTARISSLQLQPPPALNGLG